MARSELKHSASRVGALYIFFIIQQFASSSAFVLNRRCAYPSAVCELSATSSNNFVIQQINQDSKDDFQLEEYSKFCIGMFHNSEEESGSIVSRKWKDIKLAMLQKAQMIDLSVPFNGNRSVFVARAHVGSDKDTLSEIIGCCEVIEERIVISQEQNQSPRIRPIIENLAVEEKYRRRGVGKALLEAVQENAQTWIPFHGDIFAQVEADNLNAREFFIGNNFEVVFTDRDCKKDDIEGLAFSQTTITKLMLGKVIDT